MMGIERLRAAVFGASAAQTPTARTPAAQAQPQSQPEADRYITRKLRPLRWAPPPARSAPTFAWRKVVAEAAAMWAATRVTMAAFTYFAVLIRIGGHEHGSVSVPLHNLLTAWNQWDGYWYTTIAARGYWTQQSTAFFPLYPLLIKAGTLVIGPHWLLSAMAVSQLAALGAFVGVGLLAAHEMGSAEGARRAVWAFAAYPLALFLTAPYTEGLFVAWAAFCLFFARRGAWRWAALCGFLAGLTRPTGIVLVPALAWEFGRQHGWWQSIAAHPVWGHLRRGEARPALSSLDPRPAAARLREVAARFNPSVLGALVLVLGAVPLAIASYMTYLYARFHHPLLFLHAQAMYWYRQNMPPWQSIPMAVIQYLRLPDLSYFQARDLFDLGILAVFAIITLLALRRQPFALTLYTLGILYLAIQGPILRRPEPDMFVSAGRFLLAAIPVFLILARWTRNRPGLEMLLISGGFMLQGLLTYYFLQGGWLI